jgi:hypothetical protein
MGQLGGKPMFRARSDIFLALCAIIAVAALFAAGVHDIANRPTVAVREAKPAPAPMLGSIIVFEPMIIVASRAPSSSHLSLE